MKRKFERLKKTSYLSISILLTIFAIISAFTYPAIAADDDETEGLKADSLDMEVGYFGGPFYHKKTFSLAEIEAMEHVKADYTFIDNMPSVVIDHVDGVRLADIISAAGIDLNSVQSFNFWTNDKKNGYFTSLTKTELIDTPRYCYYSLPENFDSIAGVGNASATAVAERVDTVISLADDWNRAIAGGEFGNDYSGLNSNTRFRLIFGQVDASTHTAGSSAKWIHKIVVVLGGAPVVVVNDTELKGKVGSILHASAFVKAADSAVSNEAEITWTSGDESIASVDGEGNITIKAEGTVTISASYRGASAQIKVNGERKETGASKSEEKISDNTYDEASDISVSDIFDSDGDQSEVLIPSKSISDINAGGVQRWRVYQMSEDAYAMPDIKKNSAALPIMGGAASILFSGGIIIRIMKFRFDSGKMKGINKHV